MSETSHSARPEGTERDATAVPPHVAPLDDLLGRLGVDPAVGLGRVEVDRRLALWGQNCLPKPAPKSAVLQLLSQLVNPLVLTLLAAAVVAVVVGLLSPRADGVMARYGDAIAIFLIVILNAVLGFLQERRAEAALEALERMTSPNARVRRDGVVMVVGASELVPGDILELMAGDFVSADARLIQTSDLSAEEAALTGESTLTAKNARQPLLPDAPLAEQATMVFLGTTIVRGHGCAVVVATGRRTELGKIGELIRSVAKEKTPLEEKLDQFGQRVLWACLGVSVLLFERGLVKGGRGPAELLLEAVSFAVAAIPEGLPAITTITLALGMQRMAKRGAIVRRLLAVETLGAASVICTDKTGTLTQNQMTVRLVLAGSQAYRVTGEGYDPRGMFLRADDGAPVEQLPAPLENLLATGALCTTATIDVDSETNRWRAIGDPTEAALLTLAAKGGRERNSLADSRRIVRELPFDSDRKRMTVVALDGKGRPVAHVKGSLEVVLPLCKELEDDGGPRPLSNEDRIRIQAQADAMSEDALRVLAIARRLGPAQDPEQELTLLGIVGMHDPPRAGAREAIEKCRRAGVRVAMITGDHLRTATAIARDLGMLTRADQAVTGKELASMSEGELRRRVHDLCVFARTTAEQKLRIVRALRATGDVVAMTGDGVNDAPALKEANIGVAMGRSGTDVARQAADLVLADDNFSTIVDAIAEGRSIYRNIQKFIFFLLSSNMGLAVAVFTVSFFCPSALPLTPLQILWINLVTNGLPALALGVDPAAPGEMEDRPRSPSEGLLQLRHYVGIVYVGLVMGALAVLAYVLPISDGGSDISGFQRAMAFSLLALSPLLHAFGCRSECSILVHRPRLSRALIGACLVSAGVHLVAVAIPSLRPVFRTFPMTLAQWALVIGLSAAILPALEIVKGIWRMRKYLRKSAVLPLLVFCTLASARNVWADGLGIRMPLVKPGEIRLDGIPQEWPTAMTDLTKTLAGSPGSSIGMRGAIAYDDNNLYVSGEIKDRQISRMKGCAEGDDHAALLLAVPRPSGGFATHEISFFPGEPGKSAGCVKYKGGAPVSGAKIVEAPRDPGFMTFEAAIPWRALGEAAVVRVGLRGALKYYDGDGRSIRNVLSTSTEVGAADLPRLPGEAEQSLEAGLLKEKGLAAGPNYERFADVAGDSMLERVMVFGRYLVVLGPHFRNGTEYYFADLVVDAATGQLPQFEVRDTNGDGKSDVVVRRRITAGDGYREVAQIFAVGASDTLEPIFQHEVGIHSPAGTISNEIKFSQEGGKSSIVVAPGASSGYSAANYREPVEDSMDPLLLPWGTVRAQVYQWGNHRFAKIREDKQAPKSTADVRSNGGGGKGDPDAYAPSVTLSAAAKPPSPDEMQEQVYALYKRDRKFTKSDRPRFDLAIDLAEDERRERLLLHGRDLVVFGKGYKNGAGYAYITLDQFADPSDILDVSARDLNLDGKAEIVVRGVLHAEAPKDSGFDKGVVVDRELLLLYRVGPQGISRVLGLETGRAIGTKRVQETIALISAPGGSGGLDIELRPGIAFGWDARTYPFNQDSGRVGGMEPLLLPWGGVNPVRYHWDGASFARVAR